MDQNNGSVGSLGVSAPIKICLLTTWGKSVPEYLGKYTQQLKKTHTRRIHIGCCLCYSQCQPLSSFVGHLFYFMCMSAVPRHVYCTTPVPGDYGGSYGHTRTDFGQLWATMSLLRTKPGFSVKATSAVNRWAIFFLHLLKVFYLNLFFENFMHTWNFDQIHTCTPYLSPLRSSITTSPSSFLYSVHPLPPSSGLAGNVHILYRLPILGSPDEVLWETPRRNDCTSSHNFLGSYGEKQCLCFPWCGRMVD